MFPLQLSSELLLQEPSILQQDLTMDDALFENTNLAPKSSKKRQRKSKSDLKENQNEETNENKLRKIMHRDIERQRRQEMTSLYASLRDLLPLEYMKGRRSISDHMNEAVNYIKHMESNIAELRLRRDKLKNMYISSGSENRGSNSLNVPNCVTVSFCCNGVEILIDCGNKERYGISLSRVIMELLHTGLDIVSFIYTKVNERCLYRIQSEVNPLAYINLYELQQRLANLIN